MKAGFFQFAPKFGSVQDNVLRVLSRLESVTADLIVLPECFNTGYLFLTEREVAELAEEVPDGWTCRRLHELALKKSLYVVAGLPERDGNNLYNSAVLIGPEGLLGHYRKIHLFNEEKKLFNPGNLPFNVWEVRGVNVGIMICFDWRFPEATRSLALLGADIIAHPANLVLPHCPDAMITRALENGVYAVTSDRIGVERRGGKILEYIGKSQIIAPDGVILSRASDTREELHVLSIDPITARNKKLNDYNDLIGDRKPEFYKT